jgi:hypothetical protein
MGIRNLENFEKMEDPEDREPQDLVRKKQTRAGYKKRGLNAVSTRTVRVSSGLLTFIFWVAFVIAVVFGVYKVLGAYTG